MLTPQHPLDLAAEIVVDLFAGGGGASTGIELALGYPPHIAINHDPEAVALHQANHPQTRHFVSDVFEVDPVAVTGGRPVGLLWASPDCKHFSKAKGGKPVSKKIRSLAWVVIKWAKLVRPRVICLENVEEFQTWGPLGADNRPCPKRKGRTFRRWAASLRAVGYTVDWRELRACDYGAPTIRKRLFLVARRDGAPAVWPEPTHAAPGSLQLRAKKLKPWATAASCIDWSLPCPSIFQRTRELADATKRRIAKGVMRYVVDAKQPFIVPMTHTGGDRVHSISDPLRTITTARRGELALVQAFLAKHFTGVVGSDLHEPIGTVTSVDHHSLVAATLVHNTTGNAPTSPEQPLKTVTTGGHHAVVSANLVGVGARAGQSRPRSLAEPVATITAKADTALVTSHIVKLRGTSRDGQPVTEPLHTISAQGTHHGEVRAFLIKYYGTDQDPRLAEPLHTVTTKDRYGLMMVEGEPYAIVDIGLRMLTPRELYRAQGFPESYIIDRGADGRPLTKTAQVRMCGNSVCPPLARAIVAANYAEPQALKVAA